MIKFWAGLCIAPNTNLVQLEVLFKKEMIKYGN